MNEKPIPQTPEAVAYQLMRDILESQNLTVGFSKDQSRHIMKASKQEIIDTFQECLKAMTIQEK